MAIFSIIYPVKSLNQDSLVQEAISRYKVLDVEQIIVTSAESEQKIEENIYYLDTSSRAKRMNLGIAIASTNFIIFHHPRSIIDIEGLGYLVKNHMHLEWGAFTHKFDRTSFLLDFTSFWSNYVRGDLRKIYYLDHCLFAKKSLLAQINGFPEIDIFEDTEISKNLAQLAKPKRLKFRSITSAIRFENEGFWKQAYLNFMMKIDYYLGRNHKKMNMKYEKNMDLNSDYE